MRKFRQRLWKPVVATLILGALTAVVTTAVVAKQAPSNGNEFQYAVGLWGDLPYSDVQATVGVPNLIADMNNQDLAFSVHDGDLKAGSGINGSTTPTNCADALYTQGLGYLNQLKAPAAFTPGDNDWTDCDRGSNGGFNSLERLDHERQLFFSTSYTAGQHTLKQEVQTDPSCESFDGYVNVALAVVNDNTTLDKNQASNTKLKPAACVENRRWMYKGVMYATLNVQGSCNNRCDKDPNDAEWTARNAADMQWMKDTFAAANVQHAAAVMLISQADPGFDLTDGTRAPTRNANTLAEADGAADGFQSFLVELRNQTIAFQRPVAYVHGDSHYFRVDKPLLDASGRRLENFTLVETFGDHAKITSDPADDTNDVQWLKVLVDPTSRDVFAFQPQIVPGNRVAVPAPPPLDSGDGHGQDD
jgi:hypothetical protein